jgi:hypothetical protein
MVEHGAENIRIDHQNVFVNIEFLKQFAKLFTFDARGSYYLCVFAICVCAQNYSTDTQ